MTSRDPADLGKTRPARATKRQGRTGQFVPTEKAGKVVMSTSASRKASPKPASKTALAPTSAHQRSARSAHILRTGFVSSFFNEVVQQQTIPSLSGQESHGAVAELRHGVPVQSLIDLGKVLDVSREDLYQALNLKRSTMEKRISDAGLLVTAEADKLYRAMRVFETAYRVLEDSESAKTWLTRRIRSLGGVTPLSLLDTTAGYEQVLDTLGRIEHGIPS